MFYHRNKQFNTCFYHNNKHSTHDDRIIGNRGWTRRAFWTQESAFFDSGIA